MKTVLTVDIVESDLAEAVRTVTSGAECTLYYAGDDMPVFEPTPEQQQAALVKSYDEALTAHFNRVAGERNYDSLVTATMRAGYEGPFKAEALAFAQWMDGCNIAGYALIAEVMAGTKPLPTIEEYLSSLPPMVWP